ncbi:galactose-3-o-sulfotransferase partial [Nannochloropsis oceanica]
MARDEDDKRPRGARAIISWCMASSWRRALLGCTLGIFAMVWFVTHLASNMDGGSSGSSMLSTSTITNSRDKNANFTPFTASSLPPHIEGNTIMAEMPSVAAIPLKSVKSEDDVSTLEHASPLLRTTKEGGDTPQLPFVSAKKNNNEGESLGNNAVITTITSIDSGGISKGNEDNGDTDSTLADIEKKDNATSETVTTTASMAEAATTAFPLVCPYYDDIPSPFPASFWYVKNPKTASSTLGGVFRSVAAHHGVEMLNSDEIHMDLPQLKRTIAEVLAAFGSAVAPDPPLGLANHMPFDISARDIFRKTAPVMLFTSVREPVAQFHSHFVEVCKQGKKRRESSKCFGPAVQERTAMANAMEPDAQFAYIRGDASDAESAAAQYDFVFLRERLEESLVAFMIMYGLDFADIAHVAAKVRTELYPGPRELPEELNELIRTKTTEDAKLWAKANVMLDEKITAINGHCGGKAYFSSMLTVFRKLQKVVMQECTDFRGWYKKHGFSTVLRYWGDNGQAPRCRDFVVRREMRAWQKHHVTEMLRAAMAKSRGGNTAPILESKGPAVNGWGLPKDA